MNYTELKLTNVELRLSLQAQLELKEEIASMKAQLELKEHAINSIKAQVAKLAFRVESLRTTCNIMAMQELCLKGGKEVKREH